VWQIGKPNKTVFNSAESSPNVIITDTLRPYPAADTSVFILKAPAHAFAYGWMNPWLCYLQFSYKLNKDSNAIARMEFSDNRGLYWYNLKDTVPTYFGAAYWHKFNFPDSSMGWDTVTLTNFISAYPGVDTVLFRFTFISDTVTTGKDGWMIDDIRMYYFWEGVSNTANESGLSIYPNPSKGNIYIHANTKITGNADAVIYDMEGREVYRTDCPPINGYLSLPLPDGVYVLKYNTPDEHFEQQIIIKR
jgi:hypothetical protein